MPPNPIVSLIVQGARARGLDPAAVVAVASQEGLSGRVGDGGHAYGPFQLNNAGGVITGSHPGVNDPRIQAWASGPQGIGFALDHMAAVAKGLKGPQAVSAIVSRFERPANIPREIAGANAAYGNYGAPPPPTPSPASPSPAGVGGAPQPSPQPRGLPAALLSAVNTGNQMFGLDPLPAALTAAPVAAPTLAPPLPRQPVIPGAPVPVVSGIARTALTQLGTPYQWGGQAKLGSRTDCSGLLQASARANGINIPRTTYDQFKVGTAVPLNQLKPGDAVFSHPTAQGPGHVSIYIGGGKVVEDPHTGASVEISALARNGIVGARRYA